MEDTESKIPTGGGGETLKPVCGGHRSAVCTGPDP